MPETRFVGCYERAVGPPCPTQRVPHSLVGKRDTRTTYNLIEKGFSSEDFSRLTSPQTTFSCPAAP